MGKHKLCWILIGVHIVGEIPSMLYKFFYEWSAVEENWFMNFKYPLARYWLYKFMSDDLTIFCTFFCMAISVKNPDNKLFFVACVFTMYHFIDSMLFWYDFKTSYWTYWILLATLVTCVVKILNFRFKLKAVK